MLIGEVSRRSGISTRMLRHYDTIGLVSPGTRSAGGYRDYGPDDLRRLARVEAMRSLGLSLAAIRRALDDADSGAGPGDVVEELIRATAERIARERDLLARLTELHEGGPPASWPELLELVALMSELRSPDPSRRQRAALTHVAAGAALPAVGALVEEEDPVVAGALQWAVRRAGPGATPRLVDALRSPDGGTRQRAIATLSRMPHEDVEPTLREALGHDDEVVRDQAALALGRNGVPAAVGQLLAMVVGGRADVEAAETLGGLARRYGTGDEVADLIGARLADDPPTTRARSRLVQALGEVPGAVARDLLDELTHDPDPAVRATAIHLRALRPDP